jgi:hypothetical protein
VALCGVHLAALRPGQTGKISSFLLQCTASIVLSSSSAQCHENLVLGLAAKL